MCCDKKFVFVRVCFVTVIQSCSAFSALECYDQCSASSFPSFLFLFVYQMTRQVRGFQTEILLVWTRGPGNRTPFVTVKTEWKIRWEASYNVVGASSRAVFISIPDFSSWIYILFRVYRSIHITNPCLVLIFRFNSVLKNSKIWQWKKKKIQNTHLQKLDYCYVAVRWILMKFTRFKCHTVFIATNA